MGLYIFQSRKKSSFIKIGYHNSSNPMKRVIIKGFIGNQHPSCLNKFLISRWWKLVRWWPDPTMEDELKLHNEIRKKTINDVEWYDGWGEFYKITKDSAKKIFKLIKRRHGRSLDFKDKWVEWLDEAFETKRVYDQKMVWLKRPWQDI